MAQTDQNTIAMDIDTPNPTRDTTSPLNGNITNRLIEFEVIGKTESKVSNNHGHIIKHDNVIMLGSLVPEETGNNREDKKPKRRRPNELEALGVTESQEDDIKEFDVFTGDNDKIYRKYRLRTVQNKPDYRIPSINDIPLLLCTENIKSEPELHTCPDEQCGKVFDNATKLQAHFNREHNPKIYTCSLCSQTFETNAKLVEHKNVHEGENRSYICHSCKLAFSKHCDFLLHELTHRKYRDTFVCPECGFMTQYRSVMQHHICLHFQTTATCPLCHEEVPGAHRLKEHIRKHNNKFECVECGKLIYSKKRYDEHMVVHTGVKVHQCLYCGKGFNTCSQKIVHTRIHTNDRPYSCKICDRTFIQCTDMKRHEETHDKIQKIQCDLCEKKFVRRMDLVSHMKSHNKQYACPECGKKFSKLRLLEGHVLQVHSEERPIECKACDKRFASQYQYQKHTKSKRHRRNVFKETEESK